MTISIDDLPDAARAASLALREGLVGILGDDLVAIWLHGGTTFADRPLVPGDLDICVVVAQVSPSERRPEDWFEDPSSRPSRLVTMTKSIEADHGVDFDTSYFLESEMGGDERPGGAFWERRRDNGWAIERAHWLAGQYLLLYGRPPEGLVVAPSEAQLMLALDRELEHLERHVYEGDAENPYEASYAVFNGCRILHTLEAGSPVLSKRSAGAWGLEHLSPSWHPAIQAAARAYDGVASNKDKELLRATMAPFVATVRERLPAQGPRRSGPPRWS